LRIQIESDLSHTVSSRYTCEYMCARARAQGAPRRRPHCHSPSRWRPPGGERGPPPGGDAPGPSGLDPVEWACRKCVYCRIADGFKGYEGFGVDHYLPRSKFPDLVVAWSNLFYGRGFDFLARWLPEHHPEVLTPKEQ